MSAELRDAGHAYIDRYGWRVFLERTRADGTRVAIGNCDACRTAGYEHDREMCECLTCHGFYAATSDHGRWDALCDVLPDATHLALRTGHASDVLAVDFDAKHNAPQLLHEWRERTGETWTFPETRRQRTRSGGFHLLYRMPTDVEIGSHNGVNGLRGVDVKANGGLIIVSPSPGYQWIIGSGEPADPSPELVRWARDARGSGYAVTRGRAIADRGLGELSALLADPCPEGARDEFVNTLAFTLRKAGYTPEQAAELIRPHWRRMEGNGTGTEFRWDWVLYKIRRVWSTVEPDVVQVQGRRWYESMITNTQQKISDGTPVKIGRKTAVVVRGVAVPGSEA